jgi:hypothetical protein
MTNEIRDSREYDKPLCVLAFLIRKNKIVHIISTLNLYIRSIEEKLNNKHSSYYEDVLNDLLITRDTLVYCENCENCQIKMNI